MLYNYHITCHKNTDVKLPPFVTDKYQIDVKLANKFYKDFYLISNEIHFKFNNICRRIYNFIRVKWKITLLRETREVI